MKMLRFKILALTLLLTIGCSDDELPSWRVDQQRINELLNMSSEQATIDGTTLELYSYMWRDFMPISPPNGKSLTSINWLVDIDSVAIPNHIMLSEQYVINGDSLWTASYTEEERETQPYVIERISREGPKWEPYVEVIVIAKVVDSNTNSEYFLIRDNQTIERTD
jgi:hypothetical protein